MMKNNDLNVLVLEIAAVVYRAIPFQNHCDFKYCTNVLFSWCIIKLWTSVLLLDFVCMFLGLVTENTTSKISYEY